MADDGRARRSVLFLPGDDEGKIRKAAATRPDTCVLDLEDGVALNQKEAARRTVFDALRSAEIDFGKTERIVRLNPQTSGLLEADLAAVIDATPDGFALPKVESAEEVSRVSVLLAEAEGRLGLEAGHFKVLALIETAPGVVNLREIAGADPRLVALMFGAEDFAASIGATRTPEGREAAYGESAVLVHAAAYGLAAVHSVYVDFKDEAGLREESARAMRMGYSGKMAIHPAQVAVIHAAFRPSEAEIARARTLIAAHDAHQRSGTGAFAYEGKMVDRPLIRAAERVLILAGDRG